MRIKGSLIIVIILIISIVFCIYIGKKTKESYIHNEFYIDFIKDENSLKVVNFPIDDNSDYDMYDVFIKSKDVNGFGDLEKNSDLIVKVKLNKSFKRRFYSFCMISEVNIIEVHSGNANKNDTISIFEPFFDWGDTDKLYSTDGYLPLQESAEYILFLKKMKNSRFGNDKYIYMPISTIFGKYGTNTSKPKLYTQELVDGMANNFLYFKELKNQDVMLSDKVIYDKFLNIKNEVNTKYN